MKRVLIAAGMAFAMFQATANAAVDEEWAKSGAKEHGCLNCHAIDKKKMGPAWQDVGAKYNGKTAADLAASIKGKPIHAKPTKDMPAKEVEQMAEWILTLAK